MTFDRMDFNVRLPDGSVERIVVFHQEVTTFGLATLENIEIEEARKLGHNARVVATELSRLPNV